MVQNILRRKLAGRLAENTPGCGVDKAFSLSVARALRGLRCKDAEVAEPGLHEASLTELLELPPAQALFVLLDGPQGATGLMILPPEVLTGLIEVQVLGRAATGAIEPRKPTRTDAAMVADWVDAVTSGMGAAFPDATGPGWLAGYSYASYLDEPRPLALILEDTGYKVLTAGLSLGAQRQGRLILALPADEKADGLSGAEVPAPDDGPDFTAALSAQVMASEAGLAAILCRTSLPLARLMKIAPGDVIPLAGAGLDRIGLECPAGRVVASGRLGQHRGMRAIRVAVVSGQEDATDQPAASVFAESAAAGVPDAAA